MTQARAKVNRTISTETINRLAWAKGFEGVAGLARAINRNRTTVWLAVREPERHGPTYRKIIEALNA